MKNNDRKLGDYIQPVDVRNSDLKVSHLLGLSIDKCFIESIANTIGTDFRPYKIVKKGQFAYGPVTSRNGEKITIALLEEPECIISSSYAVFEITDTSKLLPEYLMLWFSRPEFDRYARYKSHGSVREIFDWDEMCRVELPVPDIKEQQKIVDTYNAITNRIRIKQKINENLEKTAQAIYKKMFIEEADLTKGRLGDLCKQFTGFPFDSELYSEFEGVKTLRGENVTEGKLRWDTIKKYKDEITERIAKNYLQEWDIVIGMDGSKVGKNWSLVHDFDLPLLLAQRVSCIRANSLSIQLYLYLSIQLGKFSEYVSQVNTGTTILHISGTQIEDFPILIPQEKNLNDFGNMVIPLFIERKENLEEMEKLYRLREIVVSQISKR